MLQFNDWLERVKAQISSTEPPMALMCKTPESFLGFVSDASRDNKDIVVSSLLFKLLLTWNLDFTPSTDITVLQAGLVGTIGNVNIYTDAYVPSAERSIPWGGDFPMLAMIG